jgi:hypothetical protein
MTDEHLRRAIQSGDLARVLGGSGRTGRDRDLDGLLTDCASAITHGHNRITLHQIAYRLDLDTFTTKRVLTDLHVPHDDAYANPAQLQAALENVTP